MSQLSNPQPPAVPKEESFPKFSVKPERVTWNVSSPRLSKHLSSMRGQIGSLDTINLWKKVPTQHVSAQSTKASE